ncbi:zinc-dependent metalloprotease [Actinomycetaceae bacterium MB13-C1-2]|nr:zinc-dependent metalloprotease [Actinomycetaceae bacterium MB13-C1-2]
MEDDQGKPNEEEPQDFLEQFLQGFLGPQAGEEAARAMREQGFDISAMGNFASPGAMAQAMNQFRFLMDSSSGPVNWRMVEDIGRQMAYQSGDPRLSAAQSGQVRQVLSVADLWLDPVTDFTMRGSEREAWTRAEWVDQTLPAWKNVFNPIAENVARAMGESIQSQIGDGAMVPEEMSGMIGSLSNMIPKISAVSFGAQIGQALSAMAKDSFGTSDAGFPLTQPGIAALVPTNIAAFAEGLDDDFATIQQYVAVREVAHARLLASVPWLRHDLELAVIRYAQEIALDDDAIADAARSIDPSDPESLQRAMNGGVFATEATEDQARALQRLETLLSLIEGWVETVTATAVAPYLPNADRLRELIRRRRVTGSSADKLLGELVGLKLRPRQARGAAHIFRNLEIEGGPGARDSVWAHPDFVPTSEDLENPIQFHASGTAVVAEQDSEFDREMQKLLEGTLEWDENVPEDLRSAEEPHEDEE